MGSFVLDHHSVFVFLLLLAPPLIFFSDAADAAGAMTAASSWWQIVVEASKQNLQDDGGEVDGVVVDLAAILGVPAVPEPNLEARDDGEKELGVEFLSASLVP